LFWCLISSFKIQQVTKLCDLGAEDSVCSVGWALRGTHLAVGTSTGKVQVRSHLLFVFVLLLRIYVTLQLSEFRKHILK